MMIVISTESVCIPSVSHNVKVSVPNAFATEINVRISLSENSPDRETSDVSNPVTYQSRSVSKLSISDSFVDKSIWKIPKSSFCVQFGLFWISPNITGISLIEAMLIVMDKESSFSPSESHKINVSVPNAFVTELNMRILLSENSPDRETSDVSNPVIYQSKNVPELSTSDSFVEKSIINVPKSSSWVQFVFDCISPKIIGASFTESTTIVSSTESVSIPSVSQRMNVSEPKTSWIELKIRISSSEFSPDKETSDVFNPVTYQSKDVLELSTSDSFIDRSIWNVPKSSNCIQFRLFWIFPRITGTSFIETIIIVISTGSASSPSVSHNVNELVPNAFATELKTRISSSEYSPDTVTSDVFKSVIYQSKDTPELSISNSFIDRSIWNVPKSSFCVQLRLSWISPRITGISFTGLIVIAIDIKSVSSPSVSHKINVSIPETSSIEVKTRISSSE